MLFDTYIEILDPQALYEGLNLLKIIIQRMIREAQQQYPTYAFPSLDICQYIENNHADSNLSQSQVADHFQIGESYLSRCFKAGIGQTYSDYPEKTDCDGVRPPLS